MSTQQKDSLGNRMKEYEKTTKIQLMQNMPIIIRLDGCRFSKYTAKMNKPFDNLLINVFEKCCLYLAENIPGVKYVYHQSDEISLLLRNDDTKETQAWFKNDLQKMVSVTASMLTAKFNEEVKKQLNVDKLAHFDSRVFLLPEREVHNYFLWRQQDCIRNSISMTAQCLFKHKELQNKSTLTLLEMMKNEKNLDYLKETPLHCQRGTSYEKKSREIPASEFEKGKEGIVIRNYWHVNKEMPLLKEEKDVFYKYLK